MTQRIERSLETSKKEHFQRHIDSITSRPLTPEIIDTYADDALEDLVTVVHEITTAYEKQPVVHGENRRAHEQVAFAYYGFDTATVEATLDHIVEKADEIRELDDVIAAITTRSSNVLVPPNSKQLNIEPGDGSFGEKQVIPRLKTLFFILSNEFGIDLKNAEELRVTTGVLKDTMMRSESYNMVEAPTIDRVVLVCDEEGNATYVFDSSALEQVSIGSEDLSELSKDDLKDLLEEEPSLGQRIIYTNRFVPNLVSALKYGPAEAVEAAGEEEGHYLQRLESVPDGYVSLSGFAKQLGIDPGTLGEAVAKLGDELGEVSLYKFKYGAATKAYSPLQQQLMRDLLEQNGALIRLPDDYLPLYGVATAMSVERSTVSRAIEQLEESLGEVVIGRREGAGAPPSPHYSPSQQAMIREQLEINGSFSGNPPEGFLPIFRIAGSFGTDFGAVQRAIVSLGSELGEPIRAKNATSVSDHYSPVQQEMIRRFMESKGLFAGPPPEGYLSDVEIQRLFGGVTKGVITRAIEGLGDELGNAVLAKLDRKHPPQNYYSPDQVEKIHGWILREGRHRKDGKFIRDLFS